MKLDIASDNADLDGRKGQCIRLYAFVCQYCGMVHVEGHANTPAITQAQAARQACEADWTRRRGKWYCPSCEGMERFVQDDEEAVAYVGIGTSYRERDWKN